MPTDSTHPVYSEESDHLISSKKGYPRGIPLLLVLLLQLRHFVVVATLALNFWPVNLPVQGVPSSGSR